MDIKKNNLLFNLIAPIYGLFYKGQKKRYKKIINKIRNKFDISEFDNVIDIGCGTGALCSVLNSKGLDVTGVDFAENMLKVAREKNKNIQFLKADILKGIPFKDQSFNLAMASYVAHGLTPNQRKQMYYEMSRIAKDYVIIHDYNNQKKLLTSIIEWLEGGDYFNFIKNPQSEMENCIKEMEQCFSEVKVIKVEERANWYICKPK